MLLLLGIVGGAAVLLTVVAVVRERSEDFRTVFGVVTEDSEFRKLFASRDQRTAKTEVSPSTEEAAKVPNECEVPVGTAAVALTVKSAALGK